MLTMTRKPSSSLCRPRWATERTPSRQTFGPALGAIAKELGQPLMPWQQEVANVGLEIGDDGRPAYREVIVTVPRQSGKTILSLGWQLQRALGWRDHGPQRIVYSAQTGNDARKKLVEDHCPLLEPRRAKLGIRRILRGMGNEAIEFRNGSRIVLLASSSDSGHGKTVDLAIKDEYFADTDDRRDQSLVPAMATKRFGQTLTASTMGTEESVPLNRAVERGRSAVESGRRHGVAYFEWSAYPECDPDDPEVWWSCMPALGHTITDEVVEHARLTLTDGEFRRAFLNLMMVADEHVFMPGVWQSVTGCDFTPEGGVVLGVDVNAERSHASIVAADGQGRVEVIEFRAGTGWVAGRTAELQARWKAPVVVHSSGPAKSLLPELDAAGVKSEKVSDLSAACASFYDRVLEGRIAVRTSADLDAAVAGAHRKMTGDTWQWARRTSTVDLSPLVAATLAVWVAGQGIPVYNVLDSVR